jgi:hypothetical protein
MTKQQKMRSLAAKFHLGELVEVTRDDGTIEKRVVREEPWELGNPGSGRWVIGLRGIPGGYDFRRVRKVRDSGS